MDIQERVDKSIGYYYRNENGRVVYIPMDRGQGALEYWLEHAEGVETWIKIGVEE